VHPAVAVDCLDASERMLQLARERVEQTSPDGAARIRFLHEDITSWIPPKNHYDLIVTHFVLDCFRESELALIIEKLPTAATKDAIWLLADFRAPSRGFTRLRARVWLGLMYGFFRVTARIEANELIDPTPFIRAQGFALATRHQFKGAMLKSESWQRK
jgi:SAM-dependent methyltransferase